MLAYLNQKIVLLLQNVAGMEHEPDNPVTTSSIPSSLTHSVAWQILPNNVPTSCLSSSVTSGLANTPAAPSPTSAGVFGIARTTCATRPSGVRNQSPKLVNVIPAAILSTVGSDDLLAHAAPSSAQTKDATCGLTAMTTMSASSVAMAFEVVVRTPRVARLVRTMSTGSETVMCDDGVMPVLRRPLMMAVAMFPPPMKAILHDSNDGIVAV